MKFSKKIMDSVSDLSLAAIGEKPVKCDWSMLDEDDWSFYEVSICDQCQKLTFSDGRGDGHEQCLCEDHRDMSGPMMNYYYAIPGFRQDPWEAAIKIKGLPLCLVKLTEPEDGEELWALALTGGGMDLSWEICEGYVALGYIPPSDIGGGLPEFAGMELDESKLRVAAACNRGFEIARDRAVRDIERLGALIKKLRGSK